MPLQLSREEENVYDLKSLQKKEVEILQAIHDASEALGIKYVIMHGSLLGAVRHKGFIPWDDDIDVCMPREDYDRFVKEGGRYLPENLKIQHVLYEKECPNLFAKVRDSSTVFLHEEHVNLNINQGVFIDVFPVDRIKKGQISIDVEYRKRRLFNIINACYDMAYVKTIKRPLRKIIGYLVHYVVCKGVLFWQRRDKYILREEKRRRRGHERGDDCTFVSISKKITGPYSLFLERTKYEFEESLFYGPKDYDALLSLLYGDYMKVPPKEEQITHKPLLVDLSRGYSKQEIDEIVRKIKKTD